MALVEQKQHRDDWMLITIPIEMLTIIHSIQMHLLCIHCAFVPSLDSRE